jgi:6-pyruvoyltetrahydropterin/6-carboxytetrahydropterin synthase
MYEVMIETEFSSAHALRGYKGKCESLHGHNWKIEIYVRGTKLDEIGLLVDFKELKQATKRVMDYLDHKNLNELPPFNEKWNPSSENIARYILDEVGAQINTDSRTVYKVRAWETPTTVASYQLSE